MTLPFAFSRGSKSPGRFFSRESAVLLRPAPVNPVGGAGSRRAKTQKVGTRQNRTWSEAASRHGHNSDSCLVGLLRDRCVILW